MNLDKDLSARAHCDECGRTDRKITRNLFGHRYCDVCYARQFKNLNCSLCGQVSRLLKTLEAPVCRKCEKDKPCLRCGKVEFALGKLTSDGPVCNACSVYFRDPQPCDACSTLTQRRSKVSRFGGDLRLCPSCAQSDYETCSSCRRRRLLTISPDGKKVCNVCLAEGERQCKSCGYAFPAGRGTECEPCYWLALLNKRIDQYKVRLYSKLMRKTFSKFGCWLGIHTSSQKAAVSLTNYVSFFETIEIQWGTVPSYAVLVSHFGPEGLRRVRLPMTWLGETHVIEVDHSFKEHEAEERRIEKLIHRRSWCLEAKDLIELYQNVLMKKYNDGQIKLLTVRLSLTPAVLFLDYCSFDDELKIDQKSLNGYLERYPGQRASISGFISCFYKETGVYLKLNSKKVKKPRSKRKEIERALKELVYRESLSKTDELLWVSLCLEYFHQIAKRHLSADPNMTLVKDRDGILVNLNYKKYWIPDLSAVRAK